MNQHHELKATRWPGKSQVQFWAARLRWLWAVADRTNRRRLHNYLGAAIGESLLPALLVLIGRRLINGLVAGLQAGEGLSSLIPWLVLGTGLAVGQAMLSSLRDYWQQCLQDELNLRIGEDLLSQAERLELALLESNSTQDQIERAKRYGNGLAAQTLFKLVLVLNQSLRFATLMGVLFWIEPLAVAVVLLLGLPYLFFTWRLAGRAYAIQQRRTHKQRWNAHFIQVLTNARWLPEVKVFHLAPFFIGRFRAINTAFLTEDRHLYWLTLVGKLSFTTLALVILYALFVRMAGRVYAGLLTVGDVAIYIGTIVQLQSTAQTLIQNSAALHEQLLHLKDLQAFLTLEASSNAPSTHSPSHLPLALLSPYHLPSGPLEFDNVSFTYAGSGHPTLTKLSLRLEPGETVALVGENGAGKSTLAKLLLRLYEPTVGTIRFAGHDLRSFDRDTWQKAVGIVFQSFTSYEATVHENIAFGNWPHLQQQRAEVMEIAGLAQVEQLVAALPQGYETLVGWQLGQHKLSLGQWQRLALARGLARRDARLLILDEPSASLDARAEYELLTHLRQTATDRITVLISHRFSTISMADRILVLEKGRLTEMGTHADLLAQGGHYAALYWFQQQSKLGDSEESVPLASSGGYQP